MIRVWVYMKKNHLMVKGFYSMKLLGSRGNKFICKVIVDRVSNVSNNNGEIGLQRFFYF